MLSGVSIICFAASYTIVLAMEISRLTFRSGIRGALMIGFAAAGMIAHTAFLYHRAVSTQGPPLSSWQDWYLVAAWGLMLVYFYLLFYFPRTYFGMFLLPLVLGLIVTAWLVANPQPFARGPASQAWGAVHAVSLVLAVVALLTGFAAGVMYLGQDRRLKRKIPSGRGLRLPSLEWLHVAAERTLAMATVMLGVGVASGMILNVIHRAGGEKRLPWSDPLVICTALAFVWLLAAAASGLFYRPLRQGRNVAYLAILSFLFLMAALVAGLTWNTQHGGRRKPADATAVSAATFLYCKSQMGNRKLRREDKSPPSEKPRDLSIHPATHSTLRTRLPGPDLLLAGSIKYEVRSTKPSPPSPLPSLLAPFPVPQPTEACNDVSASRRL